MSASIVVGLGFGDEGKGLATDYLCSKTDRPLVIRFNGGQQAGHTVCLPDGRRHVFSNFGAGTLRGAATYWSSYCTFALPNLLREYKALMQLNVSLRLYLDKRCAVTTHYDVLYNRLQEQQRCGAKHGSCGMGFGATVQRQEKGVSLTAEHLLQPEICSTQLTAIRAYYTTKAKAELNIDFTAFEHDAEDARFLNYAATFQQLINEAVFINTEEKIFQDKQWNHYVFEGAQGILLDMDVGYFPHVTRSHTTAKNALEIIERNKKCFSSAEIFYVSRIYHTRHGEGPFVQGKELLKLKNNEDETNIFNDHQGNFRTGPLDINKVQYALDADDQFSNGITKNLILTCLDQADEKNIIYSCDDNIKTTSAHNISSLLKHPFDKVLMSRSACSEAITGGRV